MTIVIVEAAASGLAKTIASQAVTTWMSSRAKANDRGKNLNDLLNLSIRDKVTRRRFERQVEDIVDSVTVRLKALIDSEFATLDAGDISAAVAAVNDTLAKSDLSDAKFFEADANAVKLSRQILERIDLDAVKSDLGIDVTELFMIVLKESLDSYVAIVVGLEAFLPRSSQELLARISSIGGELERVLDRLPMRRFRAPEGTDFDEDFRREYLALLDASLQDLELFGIDIHNFRPRTNLGVAYVSLSVNTGPVRDPRLARPPLPPRTMLSHSEEDPWDTADCVVRVEKALSTRQRILVRGEAGSGKSTLLRWLAISAARESFGSHLSAWNGMTPFLIKLRSFAGQELPRPAQFVEGVAAPIVGHMPEAWVDRQLHSGNAMILIDGVDELIGHQRSRVKSWLRGILTAYPKCRAVITSRPAAATNDWLSTEGFETANLEPMTPTEIRNFVHHWHLGIKAAGNLPLELPSPAELAATLLGRLRANPHLFALASSPLLCAMLCALNMDRKGQLPRSRMGLYAAALGLLLHRRDQERNIPSADDKDLDDNDKMLLLADLAWRLSVYNRAEIDSGTAAQWVDKRLQSIPRLADRNGLAVFDHLLHRSGVIREPVKGRIDFVHRTFQEYLAALEAARQDHVELLIEKGHLDQWRETVIMAAGLTNVPLTARLLGGLLDRAAGSPRHRRKLQLVAASCLETVQTIPDAELRGRVEACLDELTPPRRSSEASSLASAGLEVLSRLPQDLSTVSEAVAAACVRSAWLINGPEGLSLLSKWGKDSRDRVVAELVLGWSYFDPMTYATQVLADSPLRSGAIGLHDPDLYRCAAELKHLRHLSILCPPREIPALKDVPKVKALQLLGDTGSLLDYGTIPNNVELETLIESDVYSVLNTGLLARHSRLKLLSISAAGAGGDLRWLSSLSDLVALHLRECEEVEHFPNFSELAKLRHLSLLKVRKLRELGAFSGPSGVQSLTITDSSLGDHLIELSDKFKGLETLAIRFDETITSIESFAELVTLRDLDIEGCVNVSDLRPIARLRKLEKLDLRGCRLVSDLSPLGELPGPLSVFIGGISESFIATGLHPAITLLIDEGQVSQLAESEAPHKIVTPRPGLRHLDPGMD